MPLPSAGGSSIGITKEHGQGCVKKVYLRYLHAASKLRFVSLVLAVVMQWAVYVLSTQMLRLWAERNYELGRNLGLQYIFAGVWFCSLSSIDLAAA